MSSEVIFRRINGRVVPIRKSGSTPAPKSQGSYRRPTKTEHNFRDSISTAGAVGGLVYTKGKIAKFSINRKISSINDALKNLNVKRPNPFTRQRPSMPNFEGFEDTPLGKAAARRFQRDKKSFQTSKRRARKSFSKYQSDLSKAKGLRTQRAQFNRLGKFLNRRLLPISIGAGLIAGGIQYFRED